MFFYLYFLSIYLFVSLFMLMAECLSVYLSVCLSVCLSKCPLVYLFSCLTHSSNAFLSELFLMRPNSTGSVSRLDCLSVCLAVYVSLSLSVCCYFSLTHQMLSFLILSLNLRHPESFLPTPYHVLSLF